MLIIFLSHHQHPLISSDNEKIDMDIMHVCIFFVDCVCESMDFYAYNMFKELEQKIKKKKILKLKKISKEFFCYLNSCHLKHNKNVF